MINHIVLRHRVDSNVNEEYILQIYLLKRIIQILGGFMGPRKYIDCRELLSETNCSLRISGTEEEVLAASIDHAIRAHGHQDNIELREIIRLNIKDEDDFQSRQLPGYQGKEFEKIRGTHRGPHRI